MFIVAIYSNFTAVNKLFPIVADSVKSAFIEALKLYNPTEVDKDYFNDWLKKLPESKEDIINELYNSDYSVNLIKI